VERGAGPLVGGRMSRQPGVVFSGGINVMMLPGTSKEDAVDIVSAAIERQAAPRLVSGIERLIDQRMRR
jgi:hypothetical protein